MVNTSMEFKDFKKWIVASHILFEIFEGRYDVYMVCRDLVKEWLNNGKCKIKEEQVDRIKLSIEKFDYDIYLPKLINAKNNAKELGQKIVKFFEDNINCEMDNPGWCVAPYLFTWNFRRFGEYLKKRGIFDVADYFKKLGCYIKKVKEQIERVDKKFYDRKLYKDEINETLVREVFTLLNNGLKEISGVKQNEPVGTIKILHIIYPDYFPLLDNYIAKAVLGAKAVLDEGAYIRFMKKVKGYLKKYDSYKLVRLERKFNLSILKLMDEGLYIMCSVNLNRRVLQIGLNSE